MNILDNDITKNFDKLWGASQEKIGRIILYMKGFYDSFKPDLYNSDIDDKTAFIRFSKLFVDNWVTAWYKVLDNNIDYLVSVLDQFKKPNYNFYNELYGQEIEYQFINMFMNIFSEHLDDIAVYTLIKQLRENTFIPTKITYSRKINICDNRFNIYDDIIYDIRIINSEPKIKIISKLKISDFRKLKTIIPFIDISEEIIEKVDQLLDYA